MDDNFTMLFDDSELLAMLAENLDDYFHVFFAKYQQPVFAVARGLLGNVHDAEEVTSETFYQAAMDLKEEVLLNKQDIRFLPWLLTIAKRRCYNRKRDATRLKRPPPGISLDEQATREFIDSLPQCHYCSAEQEAIRQETINELYMLLERLQIRQREVVVLHYIGGLSYPEIARILNRSLEGIKKDGSRGLHRLQELCSRNQPASERSTPWLERLIMSMS